MPSTTWRHRGKDAWRIRIISDVYQRAGSQGLGGEVANGLRCRNIAVRAECSVSMRFPPLRYRNMS